MSNKKQPAPEKEAELPPEEEHSTDQAANQAEADGATGQSIPENTGRLPEDASEWKERCLRTTAEYQNYRTRTQKEKESLGEDVRAETAMRFLPVLDNLERALATETGDEAYYKGVELIHRQMLDVLEKLHIHEIKAAGNPFDPNLMEAVMHIENDSLPPNTVTQVFTKGYRMGDRILRHAMVQVAN